jgi:DNA-directed RNA polymerase subunit RPC12/RpoP
MWQLSSVASKTGKRKKAPTAAERLVGMEQMLDLLLQASLRGRLLPSERRGIKAYLAAKKKVEAVKPEKKKGPRCPVCRSPLANPDVRRCPWCSVLLITKGRKSRRKKK